ncbi:hypothetical protein, partial [Atlantibacter hermannii]|uniref:hypothetical protein n=1 Tax=Atlantibacter hermannii TaxID=565 RepID=UPI003015A5CA
KSPHGRGQISLNFFIYPAFRTQVHKITAICRITLAKLIFNGFRLRFCHEKNSPKKKGACSFLAQGMSRLS